MTVKEKIVFPELDERDLEMVKRAEKLAIPQEELLAVMGNPHSSRDVPFPSKRDEQSNSVTPATLLRTRVGVYIALSLAVGVVSGITLSSFLHASKPTHLGVDFPAPI